MKARRWRRVDGGETSKESSTRDCRRRIITEETTPEGSPTEERRRRKTSSKGTSLEERRRGNVVVGISSWEFSSEGRQRKSDNNRNRKWSRGNETGAEKKLGFETVLRLRNCVTSSKRGSVRFASFPDTTLPSSIPLLLFSLSRRNAFAPPSLSDRPITTSEKEKQILRWPIGAQHVFQTVKKFHLHRYNTTKRTKFGCTFYD